MSIAKSGANILRIGSGVMSITDALPPGVTLQDIDGGNAFFADSGHSVAAAYGWDDPDFISIGSFQEKYRNQTDADKWTDLGWNTVDTPQGDVSISTIPSNGHSLIIQYEEWAVDGGNNLYHATLGASCVGINAKDEPSTYAQAFGALEDMPNSGTPPGNGGQDGRFWTQNYTHNQITAGDVAGVLMEDIQAETQVTPNATLRHLDLYCSMDFYWFGARFDVDGPSYAGPMYNLGRNMTDTEMNRPCRYGDVIDFMRNGNPNRSGANPSWHNPNGVPSTVFIEACAPYSATDTEAECILPAQINAAAWSTIIHGARMIRWFTVTGDAGAYHSGGLIGQVAWETPLSGQSKSNYQQVKDTDTLIHSLAEVINSPFALGYVTVSPAAVVLSSSQADAGFDVMAKKHTRGTGADGKFYIFAMPRWASTLTNQSATFTIPNTGASQVTVINESRTISVTGGGTTFTDTFADYCTVHIYRVDD